MNVLNVEAETGATGAELRQVLFGEPESSPFPRYDEMLGNLYIQVLRPLIWTGLLQETRPNKSYRSQETVFAKAPLWKTVLKLETASMVRQATRH